MDISTDYIEKITIIIFWDGENPEEAVSEGWEIIEREEPSTYKGLVNPGSVTCKPHRPHDGGGG